MEQYNWKKAYINNTLIILNILYFLYLEVVGSSEDTSFMIRYGAMYGPLVVKEKEYYRLIISIFMHFGIHHITNNMMFLFILGDNMERALGSVKYLVFYLLCGVGANGVSLLVEMAHPAQAVSAGASGAIFGVIGGLFYIVSVNKGRLEDLNSRQLAIMIIFSLCFGFTSTGVDNVAHVAGLILGIILAAVLYRKPKRKSEQNFWER